MSLPDRVAAALASLTPWPDDGSREDAPVAVDATDRLLLEHAEPLLTGPDARSGPDDVVVVDDRFGALTVGALALGAARVRLHTDALTAERAVHANVAATNAGDVATRDTLGPDLVRGARLVLLQLPRSLDALREVAGLLALEAADDVVLLAGGRVKHMTHAMNDVLAESFAHVHATHAQGKSRVLVARGLRRSPGELPDGGAPAPEQTGLSDPELLAAAHLPPGRGVAVVAHGGVFAGAGLDLGTRALLRTAAGWPGARDAVDLGCGTGLLAAVLALRDPATRVVAADRSAAAVASARATAAANGLTSRVTVVRDDAGDSLESETADLVLCNPPFHDRATVSTDAAHRMFMSAGRVLRPGGELWCVFNSMLRYRPALERAVGPTTQVARDPRFTVTRSVRR